VKLVPSPDGYAALYPSYRDLLNEVRYETAIDLMQNTVNTITDIASLPGYSDPSLQ
jgi:AraC-like DNA-binding protein